MLPVILPGDQLVPAADMSGCQRYPAGDKLRYEWNRQHTELFAIWPAKLGACRTSEPVALKRGVPQIRHPPMSIA